MEGKAAQGWGLQPALVGYAAELGYLSSFGRMWRATVMSFCGGALKSTDKKLPHKGKVLLFLLLFTQHRLEALSCFCSRFNTNRKKIIDLRGWPTWSELSYLRLKLSE